MDKMLASTKRVVIRVMVLMQAAIAFHFHNVQPTVADAAGVCRVQFDTVSHIVTRKREGRCHERV